MLPLLSMQLFCMLVRLPSSFATPSPPKKNKKEKLLIVKHRMDVDMTIWLSTMGQDMVHDAPLKILARLSTNE